MPTSTAGGLLLLMAVASGPEDWAALHSGRLMHALDRDASAAISVYEAVIEHLDEDDPLRADYLYWLGRAWFEAGHTPNTLAALDQVDRRATVSSAARSLKGRIQLDAARLPSVPTSVDPAATPRPLISGWGTVACRSST